jgi:FlaA1/EpsC-like NDP-sugar epimerase
VLDMGEPISILELARTLIQLSGKTEDQVPICFTGLREREKLYEELVFPSEAVFPTCCQKIKRIRGRAPDWRGLAQHLNELRASMNVNGAAPIRTKLRERLFPSTPAALKTPFGPARTRLPPTSKGPPVSIR